MNGVMVQGDSVMVERSVTSVVYHIKPPLPTVCRKRWFLFGGTLGILYALYYVMSGDTLF